MEILQKIKPRYEKYKYDGRYGYQVHIGDFTVLITEKDPGALMVFRDGVGKMRVDVHNGTGWNTYRTPHSGCPVDIMLEDEEPANS